MRKQNLVLMLMIFVPSVVLARNLSGGISSLGEELRQIMAVLGPVMLIIAGGMFWFSKQAGLDRFISTIIGIALFGGASTIYSIVYRAFN